MMVTEVSLNDYEDNAKKSFAFHTLDNSSLKGFNEKFTQELFEKW